MTVSFTCRPPSPFKVAEPSVGAIPPLTGTSEAVDPMAMLCLIKHPRNSLHQVLAALKHRCSGSADDIKAACGRFAQSYPEALDGVIAHVNKGLRVVQLWLTANLVTDLKSCLQGLFSEAQAIAPTFNAEKLDSAGRGLLAVANTERLRGCESADLVAGIQSLLNFYSEIQFIPQQISKLEKYILSDRFDRNANWEEFCTDLNKAKEVFSRQADLKRISELMLERPDLSAVDLACAILTDLGLAYNHELQVFIRESSEKAAPQSSCVEELSASFDRYCCALNLYEKFSNEEWIRILNNAALIIDCLKEQREVCLPARDVVIDSEPAATSSLSSGQGNFVQSALGFPHPNLDAYLGHDRVVSALLNGIGSSNRPDQISDCRSLVGHVRTWADKLPLSIYMDIAAGLRGAWVRSKQAGIRNSAVSRAIEQCARDIADCVTPHVLNAWLKTDDSQWPMMLQEILCIAGFRFRDNCITRLQTQGVARVFTSLLY